jgi:hypothetical protein
LQDCGHSGEVLSSGLEADSTVVVEITEKTAVMKIVCGKVMRREGGPVVEDSPDTVTARE